ncbi:MAG: phosphotransferase [Spirochaetales bacterium]|nr:phosphotransferase [Spirochaetales bacterium]
MRKLFDGFTSEIFEYDTKQVLKLYKQPFGRLAEVEFSKLKTLHSLGIPVPEPHNIINIDDRSGYTMELIEGITFSRYIEGDSSSLNNKMDDFVKLHHEIHQIKSDDACFDYLNGMIINRINNNTSLSGNQKKKLTEYLDSTGQCALCHNDFHFNNVLVRENGFSIIDWNGAGYGHHLLDMAKTVVLFRFFPEQIAMSYNLKDSNIRIIDLYLEKYSKLNPVDLVHLKVFEIIRLAELTSLNIPGKDKLLAYLNSNFIL